MTEPVKTSVVKNTGIITLNRPKALNSLSHEMVLIIRDALKKWRDDDSVHEILIEAAERGFCAGGDVRAARQLVLDGKAEEADRFFADEYAMNLQLANYPKPVGALIDGVVMGGGQGISMHGNFRVITENAFASMPEMAIGFITDVGMSKHLQEVTRSKAMGRFLALTGYRLTPDDMLETDLATHFVPHDELPELREAIIEWGWAPATNRLRGTGYEYPLEKCTSDIEKVFIFDSWAEIRATLDEYSNKEFVEFVDKLLEGASPASLTATAELLAANSEDGVDLKLALDNELRLAEHMIRQPDFAEGVRAVLVDKSKDAKFATPEAVGEYRQFLH